MADSRLSDSHLAPDVIANTLWDTVVIGTGFGGSMMALQLARAGQRVLLLERGSWVARDESAWDPTAILLERKYRSETAVVRDNGVRQHPDELVGGNSVIYGTASLRMREADLNMGTLLSTAERPDPAFVDWPIRYAELEPFYAEAEQLLGVAGVAGSDPTESARSSPFPFEPAPYSTSAQMLADAATARGLHPFPLPVAINFSGAGGRTKCIQCGTCDLFPCKLGAKNDLAVTVLPEAIRLGAVIRPRTIVERLVHSGGRITSVECIDMDSRARFTVRAGSFVVSAGAVASSALLLRSGLDAMGPNGRLIGRHLMLHCSGIAIGIFLRRTNPEDRFLKQVAISDFYFGAAGQSPEQSREWWGVIQALQVPPREYLLAMAPVPFKRPSAATRGYHLYAICLAHDEPNPENRVMLHPTDRDPYGVALAQVVHRYSERDLRARDALHAEARKLLRKAGAVLQFRRPIETLSHAVGTCRMGDNPEHAVLDRWCQFFGVANLHVVDGSFMPTSGAVNPSLTIAANALRVGAHLAGLSGGRTAP